MNQHTKEVWRVEQHLLIAFQRLAMATQGTDAHATYVEKIKETKQRINHLAQRLKDDIAQEHREAAYHGISIEYVN